MIWNFPICIGIWLKMNLDYFCYRKHENIFQRVVRKKRPKYGLPPNEFIRAKRKSVRKKIGRKENSWENFRSNEIRPKRKYCCFRKFGWREKSSPGWPQFFLIDFPDILFSSLVFFAFFVFLFVFLLVCILVCFFCILVCFFACLFVFWN